jgi:hypothetical protein
MNESELYFLLYFVCMLLKFLLPLGATVMEHDVLQGVNYDSKLLFILYLKKYHDEAHTHARIS